MRKSTEHELDLEFKSLNAQREASEAYKSAPWPWRSFAKRLARLTAHNHRYRAANTIMIKRVMPSAVI